MTAKLTSLRAIPLTASFAAIYGGEDRIPEEIRRPASHFQAIPRIGQFTTLVVAECSDGVIGLGECFGLPTPYAAAEMVNRVIAPALVGRPLAQPDEMLTTLQKYFAALGHTKGPGMEALSGVDIALWDMSARRAGVSLSRHLGAEPRPIPTYVSPVPFLPRPDHAARAAARLATGFGAVKLKIGRTAAEDIPYVAAVRAAIGPACKLMLDANCGYTQAEATTLLREIADLDIAWLEEPLPPDDLAGLRRLSEISDVPLAGGENEFTPAAMAALIDGTNVRIIQPNISRAGGISGLLAIDRIAQERGAQVAPHGVGAGVVVAATLHCAPVMPSFLTFEINRLPNPLRDDVGHGPTFDATGSAMPPPGVGHGVNVDPATFKRFTEIA